MMQWQPLPPRHPGTYLVALANFPNVRAIGEIQEGTRVGSTNGVRPDPHRGEVIPELQWRVTALHGGQFVSCSKPPKNVWWSSLPIDLPEMDNPESADTWAARAEWSHS